MRLARAIIFALAFVASAARADDLADFNAALEAVSAPNRVAIDDLRTGKLDAALLDIDRLREAWDVFERRFAGKRPAAFDGVELYGTLFIRIRVRLVGIDLMIAMGKPDAVRQALEGVRGDFYDLRKGAGVVVLADCIRDANAALDALMLGDDLNLAKPQARDDLAAKAQSYGATLTRCDGIADEAVRNGAEFRRLIDGAQTSVALMAKAIAARDRDLLRRALLELRSIDNRLALRFG